MTVLLAIPYNIATTFVEFARAAVPLLLGMFILLALASAATRAFAALKRAAKKAGNMLDANKQVTALEATSASEGPRTKLTS